MPNIKVMHFGLGPIGAAIVKQVAARPGFKIVGAIDIDPAKVGRDLGDVVGLPKRIGAKVSGDAAKALTAAQTDVVILCTDGLHGVVEGPEIAEVTKGKRVADAARELIRLANQRGGPDNVSVVVVRRAY